MKKLETINQIENKILGNIKNKLWFKNYQYKNEGMNGFDKEIYVIFYTMYATIFAILSNFITLRLEVLPIAIFSIFSCGVLSVFTSLFFNKFKNKKKKRKINNFIKKTESVGNREIINLLEGDKCFDDIKQLASFMKSHPLEKEDIDMFNEILINNLNKEELNYLFYNEQLSDMLKERGSVDYDYIICVLNILEKPNKNKYSETIDSKIKNKLFSPQNNNNSVKYEKDLIEKVVIN